MWHRETDTAATMAAHSADPGYERNPAETAPDGLAWALHGCNARARRADAEGQHRNGLGCLAVH